MTTASAPGMDNFYVACDLGVDRGRVTLGTLHKGQLSLCEIRRFRNEPFREKNSLQWNIPQLYQETIEGLRDVGAQEEPVDSISCNAWASDYLLFEADGTLITPTYHHSDFRSQAGMDQVFAKISRETIYDETGVQSAPSNTLFQLGAEKSKRLNRNHRLLPVADGFNFLLGGVPGIEMSSASTTQLFNPVTRNWSDRLLGALELPSEMFPRVVPAGFKLGRLLPEICKATGLDDPLIVTSCSHELAAALVALPIAPGEHTAYLQTGPWATMGTELRGPIINDLSRDWNYSHEVGYDGAVHFSKTMAGLWILDECRRHWKQHDREIDADLLMHLATAAEPFESLVNFTDPRFQTAGDLPLKIQAFCKETGQPVPRKPGPVARCVLESLALLYRRTLWEIEYVTGRQFSRLFLMGNSGNSLLNHFTANALQIPVTIVPADITAIGNVVVQALAMGHIKSLAEAREIVRNSFKMETIVPHAAAWEAAYNRLEGLTPA
ncbi:MAG: rhamnulokinase [Akkermansiaceae bacterium]|nr:rhamnulokinase [Verrucomicrobiales bacterium]